MELIKFFRNGGTLEELHDAYAIKSNVHKEYSNLILFKYNMIDSPFSEQIVRESRGVILDRDNNWHPVARPFDKFFNYGESQATEIDWNSAQVFEKLDGSLVSMYYYDDKWHVATSGTADAHADVMDFNITFKELFWQVFRECNYEVPDKEENRNITFIFELMTPLNRIVVQHKTNKLKLIGARNTIDGREYSLNELNWDKAPKYEVVGSFPLKGFEQLASSFYEMNPLEQEGYVVLDKHFNRVKVKNPKYIALHHMKDGFCTRRMVELVRMGEDEEFLSVFPEYTDLFHNVRNRYESFVKEAEEKYKEVKHIEDQKEFAITIAESRVKHALFNLRHGKSKTVREYLSNMAIKQLMKVLGLKDEEEKEEL